jgi:hypothetical protein
MPASTLRLPERIWRRRAYLGGALTLPILQIVPQPGGRQPKPPTPAGVTPDLAAVDLKTTNDSESDRRGAQYANVVARFSNTRNDLRPRATAWFLVCTRAVLWTLFTEMRCTSVCRRTAASGSASLMHEHIALKSSEPTILLPGAQGRVSG